MADRSLPSQSDGGQTLFERIAEWGREHDYDGWGFSVCMTAGPNYGKVIAALSIGTAPVRLGYGRTSNEAIQNLANSLSSEGFRA